MSLSNLAQVGSAVASEEGALITLQKEKEKTIDYSQASMCMHLFTNQGHFLVFVSEKTLVV